MKFDSTNIQDKLAQLEGWAFAQDGIEKNFVFRDFKEALGFMVTIGLYFEAKNHHPEWKNVYNRLFIRLSTHDAGGVTEKDFDLANEIEKRFRKLHP